MRADTPGIGGEPPVTRESAAVGAPSETPTSARETADLLRGGGPFRVRGRGTKLGWGSPPADGLTELRTGAMHEIVEHAEGDFTAILDAGVPFDEAQERFASAGQMLALDPPAGDGATIGGVVSASDSGPLRHRYGAPRDLVIGVTLALADGTVAKAGGKVIKNVAGYDLSKLVSGAFGTLGVLCRLSLRLHPRPPSTATAIFRHDDPGRLGERALELAGKPLECDALDIGFDGGEGRVLARFAGETCRERATALGAEIAEGEEDAALWDRQRAGQRADADEVVLRVAGMPTELPAVIELARERGATVVGRAAIGTAWIKLPAGLGTGDVAAIRERLRPARVQLTDAPPELRAELDPWDVPEGPELELMRRVKERFDPDSKLNPGIYAGGI